MGEEERGYSVNSQKRERIRAEYAIRSRYDFHVPHITPIIYVRTYVRRRSQIPIGVQRRISSGRKSHAPYPFVPRSLRRINIFPIRCRIKTAGKFLETGSFLKRRKFTDFFNFRLALRVDRVASVSIRARNTPNTTRSVTNFLFVHVHTFVGCVPTDDFRFNLTFFFFFFFFFGFIRPSYLFPNNVVLFEKRIVSGKFLLSRFRNNFALFGRR